MVVANGTEPKAETVERPTLTLPDGTTHDARDLDAMTFEDQVYANKLVNRLVRMDEVMEEYFDLDDDDDEDDAPPPEVVDAWRNAHYRILRFGYPSVHKAVFSELPPSTVTRESGAFVAYLQEKRNAENPEGNEEVKPNRSQRRSAKRSRG